MGSDLTNFKKDVKLLKWNSHSDVAAAFTSGGNDSPGLDTSPHCEGEQIQTQE